MSLELSLYELQDGLRELYAMREEARENLRIAATETVGGEVDAASAELRVIESSILRYLRAELKKVDGTADFILMLDRLCHEPRERKGVTERCEIDQEIDRLRTRRDNLRALVVNVKERVAFVMNEMPWREGKPKKLEGVRHTMTLRGNGGAMPVEITDESLVPDEYKRVTVTMPLADWEMIKIRTAWKGLDALGTKIEVSLSAVAEALNQPCGQCNGNTENVMECSGAAWHTPKCGSCQPIACPTCGGSGKAGVPGARFAPRGESLQIR